MATKQLKKKLLKCDSCGHKKEDVQTCNDPYSLDVDNTEIKTNLCDLCYQNRVDDI